MQVREQTLQRPQKQARHWVQEPAMLWQWTIPWQPYQWMLRLKSQRHLCHQAQRRAGLPENQSHTSQNP